MTKKYLEVDKIDTSLQVRSSLNAEAVAEYAQKMKDGEVFPPVRVFTDGKTLWLADGFHRMEAIRKNGVGKVFAEVADGNREAALRYALTANNKHGLRMTNEDKQNAVRIVWDNRKALGIGDNPSDRAIAEIAGVSKTMAGQQLAKFASCRTERPRIGADGVVRSLPRRPIPTTQQITATVSGPCYEDKKTVSARRPVPDVLKDSVGREIPMEKYETWNRRGEVSELARKASEVRCAVRKAIDGKDALFANVNAQIILTDADNLYARIAGSEPYAVCPYCGGQGCKTCHHSGFITEAMYKNVPPELKTVKDGR